MNKNAKKIVISIIIAIFVVISVFAIIKNILKTNQIKDEQQKTIIISVHDKENKNIFEEEIETNKTYFTSIMEIKQEDDYYWSYYIDEQYATTGVSECEIEENKHYSFKIEKFEY